VETYPDQAMPMRISKPLYDHSILVHERVRIDLHPGWLCGLV